MKPRLAGRFKRLGICRREFIGAAASSAVTICLGGACIADDRPTVSADVDQAVKVGLNFLDKQLSQEGFFEGEGEAAVLVASRALLALLAAGHVPDVGRHGFAARRTVDWLLEKQGPQGWYGSPERGIRPHLSATTVLSQAYGVEGNVERRFSLHSSVGKAVGAILSRQLPGKSTSQSGGGWGTGQREGIQESLAVTAVSVFALRACAGIGFAIPQPVTARALDFTLRCFDASVGAFGSAPGQRAELRSSCAGVVSLFACEAPGGNAEKLNSAERFILAHAAEIASAQDAGGGIVPLAALKLGNEVWAALGQPLMARIVKGQEKDGSWPGAKPPGRPEISRAAATASALSVLTMSYPLLPIYQH